MSNNQSSIISLLKDRASCKGCGLASLCLPVGLVENDVDKLNAIDSIPISLARWEMTGLDDQVRR